MKNLNKLIALMLLLSILVSTLFACEQPGDEHTDDTPGETQTPGGGGETTPPPFVDYVANVKLDMNSDRVRTEATVRTEKRDGEDYPIGFIDGDTTHFVVPTTVSDTGLLKARYIAINTPESTGRIEPWGKKASNFTKEKLSKATSIILESNTSRWDLDSTGDRHLVWVWYKTADMTDYRNLNLEIMQEGLAYASSYIDFVYADACRDIVAQARAHKLHVFNPSAKDPDFYYGDGVTVTLKELKANIDKYVNTTVRFEAVVVKNVAQTAYVEEYDEETGTYFGMQVYYGYNLGYFGEEILQPGNRVLIVGSLQKREGYDTYQVTDIFYHYTVPDHPTNIQLIDEGYSASNQKASASTLLNGTLNLTVNEFDEDGNETTITKTLDYGFVTMHSTMTLENLTITKTYTTVDPQSSSKGAISITCRAADGTTVVLRTVVMYKADGSLVTADAFPVGSTINANGIVDYYNGAYQLKIFSPNDIEFVN